VAWVYKIKQYRYWIQQERGYELNTVSFFGNVREVAAGAKRLYGQLILSAALLWRRDVLCLAIGRFCIKALVQGEHFISPPEENCSRKNIVSHHLARSRLTWMMSQPIAIY